MDNYISDELIEATFLFCRKRLSDSEAAKDLAQDILCEGIRKIKSGAEPISFYSYYWKMARNKYADYIRYKKEPALPLEVAGGVACKDLHPADKLVKHEEIARLNLSLSRLSEIHREIIIRFYLKEQSISKIAEELNIPAGTVKGRLFDARKNLKERFDTMTNTGKSAYAPCKMEWFWGFNMREPNNVIISSKIAQQTMFLCGHTAKTLNELADELGVAPVYLEEIIEKMVQVKLLIRPTKNKYLSCCCVFPMQPYINASYISYKTSLDISLPEKICKAVKSVENEIMTLDFYGKELGFDYLCWEFLIWAGNLVGELATESYCKKYEEKYPDEPERSFRMTVKYLLPDEEEDWSMYTEKWKGMSWSNLWQGFKTADHGFVSYINDFEQEPFPNKWDGKSLEVGRDKWINGNNISLLLDLAENPQKPLNKYEEEIASEFLSQGILTKCGEGLKVMLPIFTREVHGKINRIIEKSVLPIAEGTARVIGADVEKELLPYVRKDLMSNFIHWDMRMFFQPINVLMYYGLYDSDYLSKPEDFERSAAGLWLMTEN